MISQFRHLGSVSSEMMSPVQYSLNRKRNPQHGNIESMKNSDFNTCNKFKHIVQKYVTSCKTHMINPVRTLVQNIQI